MPTAIPEIPTPHPAPIPRPRILVAENHADTREMLRTLLAGHGFETVECADGREVLPLVEQTRPAVVLLNRTLPGLDGLAVARRIQSSGSTPPPRLVFLSTQAGEALTASAHAAGCDSFLLKPVDLVELLGIVRRLSGGQS